jgi:hypothetical protein
MYETDYLIIGTGAIGMNCADVLLEETDANILMIDQHSAPGGHWNDAYSFVRLHQPSAFYGVPSRQLGTNRIDQDGSNKGYYELPTGAEVSAYFELVMRERFLPSGRVKYLPMHNFNEDQSTVITLLSGASQPVNVRRKIIDTTFLNTTVPSSHTRSFTVSKDVQLVTPNTLPQNASGHDGHTVIGGGKTGMDTCVWLIENGANPDQVQWIVPRDSWLINRSMTQPGDDFIYDSIGGYAALLEAAASGQTSDDIFAKLEASGCMLRIDKTVQPTMYRNATISQGEIDILRTIKDVVRMGRVRDVTSDMITLENGNVRSRPNHLYIDCTAKAFGTRKSEPIFTPGRILPQVLLNGSVCMSAALVAYVEANYDDDAEKNDICAPLPLMNTPEDWIEVIYWHLRNVDRRALEKDLGRWMRQNRLSGFGAPKGTRENPDPEYAKIVERMRQASPKASSNLRRLMDLSAAHQSGNH